ncbi:MAG: hypothetical protein A2275_16440 [Bacteroidetes bacterium RIFOXYA12_FULL_35_11]|nr:MAG: hypothetical protein A2275_16440 [Bacteroidetes bacterium RIFOXYA12_FULL_35_11]OFZ02308.1 MAG: hypothetical protein A2491_13785 [Bacteroidetes bacterium RIFOXYC12_FULL_35_7]
MEAKAKTKRDSGSGKKKFNSKPTRSGSKSYKDKESGNRDSQNKEYKRRSSGSDNPDKKSFVKRNGESKPYDPDKKPFRKRTGESKPYDPDKKPFRKRTGESKPYDPDKKPFRKRTGESKPYDPDKKPFRKRTGESKPYDPDKKPFRKRTGESKPYDPDKKPFRKRTGESKPYDPDKKPFRKRTGDDKPFDSDKKLWKKKDDGSQESSERPKFNRPHSKENKPAYERSGGDKHFDKPRKDFQKREEISESFSKEDKKPFTLKKPKGEHAGTDRLNKYIANAGICSRREADEYIKAGLVKVNGVVTTEMGVRVKPEDEVRFNDETITLEKKVYILLNKPKDYITTTDDPHAKRTVMELIEGACRERVYPVGRLDRNTTGVLLLTNDGDLVKKLTHPSYNKKKIYHVFLNKSATKADLQQILEGVETEDGFVKADAINFADEADKTQVGIEIHSGQNHVVRNIFGALGYNVEKLDRVYFAGLTKKNLQRGKWRFLSEKEINMLRIGAYK